MSPVAGVERLIEGIRDSCSGGGLAVDAVAHARPSWAHRRLVWQRLLGKIFVGRLGEEE